MLINRYGVYFLTPAFVVDLTGSLKTNISGGLLTLLPSCIWLTILFYLLCFDLFYYFLHRLFHLIPVLWRFHRVHHADMEVDVSTSVRHHPVEAWLDNIMVQIFIALMGAPLPIVLGSALIINAVSVFNHCNIVLGKTFEYYLRWLIVTPDMHIIHHSAYQPETDSNYGMLFSFWDRLFASYRAKPVAESDNQQLGLQLYRSLSEQTLFKLLLIPVKNDT